MGQEEKMNLEHYEIEGLEKPSEIKKKLECWQRINSKTYT